MFLLSALRSCALPLSFFALVGCGARVEPVDGASAASPAPTAACSGPFHPGVVMFAFAPSGPLGPGAFTAPVTIEEARANCVLATTTIDSSPQVHLASTAFSIRIRGGDAIPTRGADYDRTLGDGTGVFLGGHLLTAEWRAILPPLDEGVALLAVDGTTDVMPACIKSGAALEVLEHPEAKIEYLAPTAAGSVVDPARTQTSEGGLAVVSGLPRGSYRAWFHQAGCTRAIIHFTLEPGVVTFDGDLVER